MTSIAHAIGISDEGIIIGDDGSAEGYSEENWAKPDLSAKETYATWLTQHQRWAYYLTTNVFLPKAIGVNGVSNRERVFMYHLMNQKKINLPAMIIRQMKNVKVVSTLAYGSLLTRLFEAASINVPGDGVASRSTLLKMNTLRNLAFGVIPKKTENLPLASDAQKEIMKDTEQKGKKAAKKGKSKKGSSKLVLTVEKVAVSEPLPVLVQTTINVEPSGKIVAEKAAKEAEESRLAERAKAAEAEKVARVVALADRTSKAREAAELADKLAAEREILAKAKAGARLVECAAQVESEEASGNFEATGNVEATGEAEDAEEIPLSRSNRKKAAANRRSLNKKDFYIAPSTELEDTIPEEEDFVDDEDMMDMSAEGNLDALVIEELSEDSEPEAENPEEVIQTAHRFTENVDNDDFMDNILLGQGRSPYDRDAYETLNRMAHVFAKPITTYDPNVSKQVISSPTHIHHPSPSPTTSTSEVVPPKTAPPSGSYSEVNLTCGPIFTDSTTTSTTSSLNTSSVIPSIGLTAPSFSLPSTLPSTIPIFSSSTTQTAPSSTSKIPPPSTSGNTPPVCDPLTTSSTTSFFAGLSSNYDFLHNVMNRDELEKRFGSFGFIGKASVVSEAGGAPSVEELRRMSQSGSDELLNRFAGLGQRNFVSYMYAQGIVLQELQSLKAQNLQLMSMLQLQDPSVYTRSLSTLHLAIYDEIYKLRQLALTLPTLENIALASASNVNENLEMLQQEVKEANEHYEAHEKVLPSKLDDLQSIANHILREVKSSAQGSSSSGATRILYDITPDLNNRLQSIESVVTAQSAQIAELTELLKVMHTQAKGQEKALHNCYSFVRGQTYIQNEHLTAAVYADNHSIKLLLEDVQRQRPFSGQTFHHLKAIDADFRRRMDLINSVRLSNTRLLLMFRRNWTVKELWVFMLFLAKRGRSLLSRVVLALG
ncbi:hypothetical protein M5689_006478 [Euphorbia peplus]|nr:hypothetical protein M5689_006478 [Euphorbia peplus]